MTDGIDYLLRVTQAKAAQQNTDLQAAVQRQRQAVTSKSVAMGPSRALSTPLQSITAQRLAVRLKAFRASLTPDEAALLDDWLERAARSS